MMALELIVVTIILRKVFPYKFPSYRPLLVVYILLIGAKFCSIFSPGLAPGSDPHHSPIRAASSGENTNQTGNKTKQNVTLFVPEGLGHGDGNP